MANEDYFTPKTEQVAQSCKSCRFSLLVVQRYCRRYPPTVTFNDIGSTTVHGPQFPQVQSSQWCGEWQVKK